MSSPYFSSFLKSAVVASPLPVSLSQAHSTLLVSSTSPSPPVPVPLVPPLPSPAAISPLFISALMSELKGHPSAVLCRYLLFGFHQGFRTSFSPSCIARLECASQNIHSALHNPQVVDEYLSCEVHLAGSVVLFPGLLFLPSISADLVSSKR